MYIYILDRVVCITYISLLLIPSWALAIDPFLSPPADGLSLITLSQPQRASLAGPLRLREL